MRSQEAAASSFRKLGAPDARRGRTPPEKEPSANTPEVDLAREMMSFDSSSGDLELDVEDGRGPPFPGMLCPLTLDVMIEPMVVVETGLSYECEDISRWLASNDFCPASNRRLTTKELVPNYALKAVIEEWHKRPITVSPLMCIV